MNKSDKILNVSNTIVTVISIFIPIFSLTFQFFISSYIIFVQKLILIASFFISIPISKISFEFSKDNFILPKYNTNQKRKFLLLFIFNIILITINFVISINIDNLAYNKKITSCGYYKNNIEYSFENANDENINTYWEGLHNKKSNYLLLEQNLDTTIDTIILKLNPQWEPRTQKIGINILEKNIFIEIKKKTMKFNEKNNNTIIINNLNIKTKQLMLVFYNNSKASSGQISEIELYKTSSTSHIILIIQLLIFLFLIILKNITKIINCLFDFFINLLF